MNVPLKYFFLKFFLFHNPDTNCIREQYEKYCHYHCNSCKYPAIHLV